MNKYTVESLKTYCKIVCPAAINNLKIKNSSKMIRNRSTTTGGNSFDAAIIEAVWKKGAIVPGYNKDLWRKDQCSAWMKRTEYGNTSSKFGWEVDHIKPSSKGGSDHISNLQPLQWENNRHKSDDYPNWSCKVAA